MSNPQQGSSDLPYRTYTPTSIRSHASTRTTDSVAPPQPPFRQAAVSPTQSTHSNHPHPNIEDTLNATAAHVFPEQPAPNKRSEGGEADKDVSHEGIDPHLKPPVPSPHEEKAEARDPDQTPLMKGTPLDELKTPMFERAGMFGKNAGVENKTSQRRSGSDDTIHAMRGGTRVDQSQVPDPFAPSPPPEEMDEDGDLPQEMTGSVPAPRSAGARAAEGAVQPNRPGFGASKEIGSVCQMVYSETLADSSLGPHGRFSFDICFERTPVGGRRGGFFV